MDPTAARIRRTRAPAVVSPAATLTGCGTTATRKSVSTGAAPLRSEAAATTSAAGATTGGSAAELKAARERQLETLLHANIVYFDFDRSDIRDEDRPVIALPIVPERPSDGFGPR
jgi:hypothetical protein